MKRLIKIGFTLLASTSLLFAESDVVTKQNIIKQKLDSIMVKEGVEIGGNFRSELINSKIEGNAANPLLKQSEEVTYTQVDMDFKARPNTSTTAHAIMRMHADWPTFFGALNNPISVRWISLDGKIGNYAYYHVGDFKTKWSPFTLWNWSTEFLGEADIFNEERSQAMADQFSAPGDENRALQGVDLKLAAKASVFDYLGLNLLGARLRSAFIPKTDPVTTGANLYVTSFEAAEYDRLLYGVKGDVELFNTNIGLMLLNSSDIIHSTKYITTPPLATQNIAVNLNADIAKFIGNDKLTLNLKGEFGLSNYSNDTGYVDTNYTKDLQVIDGTALNVGAVIGMDLGAVNFEIDGGMTNTSKNFRADLSQSPSYVPREILNIDNDSLNAGMEHFSIFDARYHSVFKSVTKNYTERGIEYVPYPSSKTSYTNVIIAAEESGALTSYVKSVDALLDVVGAEAFGPATPNINIINASLNVGALNQAVVVDGYFSNGKNNEEITTQAISAQTDTAGTVTFDTTSVNIPTATFTNIGFGLTLNVDKFLSFPRPIKINGGFEMANASRDASGSAFDNQLMIKMDLKSSLINAGLYLGLVDRLSLLAGYQIYSVKDDTYSMDVKETNLLAGLEYKVNSGAYILFKIGQWDFTDNNNENNNFNTPIYSAKINVNF